MPQKRLRASENLRARRAEPHTATAEIELIFRSVAGELDKLVLRVDGQLVSRNHPFLCESHRNRIGAADTPQKRNHRRFVLGLLRCKQGQSSPIVITDEPHLEWGRLKRCFGTNDPLTDQQCGEQPARWIRDCLSGHALSFYKEPCNDDELLRFHSEAHAKILIKVDGHCAEGQLLDCLVANYSETINHSVEARMAQIINDKERRDQLMQLATTAAGSPIPDAIALIIGKCVCHESWSMLYDFVKDEGAKVNLETIIDEIQFKAETIQSPEEVLDIIHLFGSFRDKFLAIEKHVRPLFDEFATHNLKPRNIRARLRELQQLFANWRSLLERREKYALVERVFDYFENCLHTEDRFRLDSTSGAQLDRSKFLRDHPYLGPVPDSLVEDKKNSVLNALNQLKRDLEALKSPVFERRHECNRAFALLINGLELKPKNRTTSRNKS